MHGKKHMLLIVDSSATYLFYMGMLLKRLEYAVHSVTTAEQALQSMDGILPSLVITETDLPSMNGVDLLIKMKQNQRLQAIPVIIHTSSDDPDMRKMCMVVGCAGYIKKPCDPETLYKTIQAATEFTPRQNIRIDTSLRVEVSDETVRGKAVRTEEVTALSEGGLYIKTIIPAPVHTMLSLKIFIRDREIRTTASVQYSSAKTGGQHKVPGMGMKFVNIRPEDQAFVREFIRERIENGLPLGSAACGR